MLPFDWIKVSQQLPSPVAGESERIYLYDMRNIDAEVVLEGHYSRNGGFVDVKGNAFAPTHWHPYQQSFPGWPLRWWLGGDSAYMRGRRRFLKDEVHYDLSAGKWWQKLTESRAFEICGPQAEWSDEGIPMYLGLSHYPVWVQLADQSIHAARVTKELIGEEQYHLFCVDSRCGMILNNVRWWKPRFLDDEWPEPPETGN